MNRDHQDKLQAKAQEFQAGQQQKSLDAAARREEEARKRQAGVASRRDALEWAKLRLKQTGDEHRAQAEFDHIYGKPVTLVAGRRNLRLPRALLDENIVGLLTNIEEDLKESPKYRYDQKHPEQFNLLWDGVKKQLKEAETNPGKRRMILERYIADSPSAMKNLEQFAQEYAEQYYRYFGRPAPGASGAYADQGEYGGAEDDGAVGEAPVGAYTAGVTGYGAGAGYAGAARYGAGAHSGGAAPAKQGWTAANDGSHSLLNPPGSGPKKSDIYFKY